MLGLKKEVEYALAYGLWPVNMLIVYKLLKLRINSAYMTNKHDIIKGVL